MPRAGRQECERAGLQLVKRRAVDAKEVKVRNMNGETETKRRKSGTTCTQQAIFSATKEKSDRRRRFGHAEEVGREQRDLQARHRVPRIQDSSAAGADGQEDDPGAAHHEHQEKRHQQRIRVWQGHCKRHDHQSDRLKIDEDSVYVTRK